MGRFDPHGFNMLLQLNDIGTGWTRSYARRRRTRREQVMPFMPPWAPPRRRKIFVAYDCGHLQACPVCEQ
jgi:hypothetical protein